ncbi:MAG TPA: rhodanese-like domain-containing protein [Verrucomicrobiota bacterium]|nr:rhodanese-like domain-containing protein [Verrucomicrobiota bacterium]HNT14620.1 rhodanese-like domain-containing protein [Verrucomicrobiota bacterium]
MKKLLALFTVLLGVTAGLAGEFADLTVKEVKALVEAKQAVLIDVNGTASFKRGRVPGALNFAEIENKLATVLPADKSTLIVAYCGHPKCLAYKEAAEAAVKLGYTNVKFMSAGIQGWKAAGEKVEKSK